MKVLVTGSSKGIGRAICDKFLEEGYDVIGLDILPSTIYHRNYTHFVCDVSNAEELPDMCDIGILVNNAGVQNEQDSIKVNVLGAVNCCRKYANSKTKSVLNIVSVSAHNGAEFPLYTVSKGGLLAYTKNLAQSLAKYGTTVNSLSPGGVITDINSHILNNELLYDKVKKETLLNKWATCEEIADWAFFFTAVNKSVTGQDLIIDNGEMSKFNFIW